MVKEVDEKEERELSLTLEFNRRFISAYVVRWRGRLWRGCHVRRASLGAERAARRCCHGVS